jgi:O-antigen/teichoic acid export membrane protein
MAFFAVGVSVSAIIFVLDMALVGLLRGGQQLWRNTLFAIAKLAGLVAVGFWSLSGGGWGIYATWVFGNVISLVALMVPLMSKKHWSVRNYLPRWELLRELKGQALQYYFLYLALDVPASLLPVLVTVLLSPRVNAWFYVSWMIAGFIFMILTPLATVLQAASSAQPSTLAYKARVTIGIAFIISILANCVLQIATKQVLNLFGSSYVAEAFWCLRILPLAAFPFIIRSHYLSICRVYDRVVQAILTMLPSGFFELGIAVLGAHLAGLVGLSIGWVIAMYVESIFMFPTVYKAVRFVEASRPETEQSEVDTNAVHLADIIQ